MVGEQYISPWNLKYLEAYSDSVLQAFVRTKDDEVWWHLIIKNQSGYEELPHASMLKETRNLYAFPEGL